jgi:NAD(P)-dependent dehydrogenase (short-subunit alcohol dehydrogenase family)
MQVEHVDQPEPGTWQAGRACGGGEPGQDYPGRTSEMDPHPRDEMRDYEGRGLLAGKRALITGGDSGIGRAVAMAFAKEGADVAIAYLSEQEDGDAQHTAELVKKAGHRCVTIRGDLAEEANCQRAVDQTVHELGGLDILVNNVATQKPVHDFAELTTDQWDRTFKVNIYSYFWATKAAYRTCLTGAPSSTPRPSTACAATRPSSTTRPPRERSWRSPTPWPRPSRSVASGWLLSGPRSNGTVIAIAGDRGLA